MTLLDELGIGTCRVTFGKEATFAGRQVNVKIAVTPKALGVGTLDLRWISSGDLLSSFLDESVAVSGEAGFIDLPWTDQPGFARGSSTFAGWYYYAEVSRSIDSASLPPRIYRFQIPSGTTTMDLDAIDEDGQVTAVPAVAPIQAEPAGLAPSTLAALDARYPGVTAWAANTAYSSGKVVLSPSGDLVQAKTSFTSGSSYNAANWTVLVLGAASVSATYQPLLPTTAIKTAAYTTAGNEIVPVDATASGVTVTLPNAPADKTRVSVKKIDASSNAVTIATAGSDAFNKAGGSVSATLTLLNQASTVQYVHATGVWLVVASDVPLSQLDSRYASKPAAAEQTIYVTPRGNDSNDGLSLSSAKATVTAGLAALAASYSWNRGKVLLGYGTIPLGSAEIALTANTANDEFGARGLTIEGCGVGMTVLDASAQTAGVTALHLTSASKMFINLRDFELKGPAQTVAGSRGIFWESPGGNYNWQNVYVHDFETGVEFYDATLGTAVNVAIRRCATGLSTDYQTDIHTWIGCRIDYCTTGVHVGNPTTTHPSTGSQEENNLQFIGARISNNGTAVFVDDYGASGLDFDGCYFEGNTKQLTVGRSNRTDTVGPSIHFGGCYWDPYITNSDGSHDTSQQATAFDIYNPASITIDQGSKVSGPTKFAVFANLQNANAVVRIASGGIQAATAAIQQGGLNFNPNGSGLGDIDYGLPLKLDYSAGASVPAAGWRRHQMSNRTGKTFESWEGISSADGSILSQAVVRDVGGVLHIEGLTNGGVAATRVPVLPAATANYYGLIYVLIGGVGAADIPYMCVLNSLGVYVWQALTGGSGPAGQPGPGTYGTPRTADPVSLPAIARPMTTANDVRYFRVHDTATITQLSAQLLTAFAGGTAVLAVYRNNGSTGLAARPSGTPVAQGTASTTTAGTVTASLGGSIAVADGDWFAIGVDNTTAAFAGGTGISIGGFSYSQTGALGATPTFTMPTPASLVASGQFWGVWGS